MFHESWTAKLYDSLHQFNLLNDDAIESNNLRQKVWFMVSLHWAVLPTLDIYSQDSLVKVTISGGCMVLYGVDQIWIFN